MEIASRRNISLVLGIAAAVLMSKRLHAAATAVVAAVGVRLVPAPLPAHQVFRPAFFSDGPGKAMASAAVVLVGPYATPLAPQPVIWQAASDMRFRMPEGYVSLSGSNGGYLESPPDTVTSTTMQAVEVGQKPSLDNNLRQAIRADLERWMVRVVIVGPMTHEASMIRLFTDVRGRLPTDVGGVAVWWSVG
jgi:hypothetical protein